MACPFKRHAMACPFKYYCTNGIASGYLNSSPFEALTLAITIKIMSRIKSSPIRTNPIRIKQRGIHRKIYNVIEIWKFKDAFPFSLTHVDSSFRDNQQIRGPMIFPIRGSK